MIPANATVKLFRGAYALYWREGGQPKRKSLGTADFTEARQKAAELSRQDVEAHRPAVTVGECWRAYQNHLGDRPAAKTMGFEAKSVLPFFGAKLVVEVDEALCRTYIAERRALGRKDGAILTELNRVSAALGHAFKHGRIERKPHLAFPKAPPPRDVYLTRADLARFLAAIKAPHLKLFVTLALTTGARSEALLRLTWDRVDLVGKRIDFRENEGHRPKGRAVVPLNKTALDALVIAGMESKSGHVIAYRGGRIVSVKKGLATAAEAIGVPGIGPHALRHSAAVWMAEAGVPMGEIAQFLGHTSTRVTEKVYARFSPQYLERAAAALDFDVLA